MPYEMTPVLLTRKLTRTAPGGEQSIITVEIGTPAPVPPTVSFGGLYITYRFLGVSLLPPDDVLFAYGEDSVEVMTMALCGAGQMLRALPYANEIELWQSPTFFFPQMPVFHQANVVSGAVALENCNDIQQNITFEFRPLPKGKPVVIRQVLNPLGGRFSIVGVPAGTYDVAVKGYSWLRKVIKNVVVVEGVGAHGLSVSLISGDLNNSNTIDIADLSKIVGNYNRVGEA